VLDDRELLDQMLAVVILSMEKKWLRSVKLLNSIRIFLSKINQQEEAKVNAHEEPPRMVPHSSVVL